MDLDGIALALAGASLLELDNAVTALAMRLSTVLADRGDEPATVPEKLAAVSLVLCRELTKRMAATAQLAQGKDVRSLAN